ncbi:hypothetical protein KFJ24_04965 [Marinobacter sediminum]|uniref:hypothetical protein n=1 Tax=Marinobacter sediminum TaxID=256323 RepID=UPI002030809A|nr:hypothetical protein [Marinobacter sediminum]MCM0611825.1 hypothetical protein [Marinobacter sediminum]
MPIPSLIAPRTLFLGALIAAGIGQAMAANAVFESYSVEKQTEDESSLIVMIEGTGFGAKQQTAPILWLFGDDVRQNGRTIDYPSFNFGDSVATNEAKIWEHVDSSVVYHSNSRYPKLSHSYFVGNDGTVRNPLAFGGSNPPYAEKIYLSARIKPVEAWHGFRSIGFDDIAGNFDLGPSRYEAGEKISVLHADGINQTEGRIIYADTENRFATIKTSENWGKSDLNGATLVGQRTGSKMALNADQHYAFAVGSKYLRMWSGGKPGMYSTMSTNRLIVGYRDSSGNLVAKPETSDGSQDTGYGIPNLTSKLDWRLLETFIDQETDILSAYVDIDNSGRRYLDNLDISDKNKLMDRSPTISQLGLDAAGGADSIDAALYFGEIYFDNTPKRIMISNKQTYEEAGSELEIQFPIQWTDNKVQFELRAGELDTNETLYVYVFDENSNPNYEGIEICISCKLGVPAQIDLDVK